MQEQNLKNHTRLLPVFHYVVTPIMLALIVGAITNLNNAREDGFGLYSASLILLLSLLVTFVAYFARSLALKAQDRAIRAEENLRYFAITGKLLDSKLSLGQVIALRFAPNNEFVDLAHRAVAENLSAKDIKKAVQNWRGDYHRV